jgi:signal transduction histidine kinase
MTQSAVTAHIHSFRPQPSARAQGVRGVQVVGHGRSAVQQVSELERHRLARELHGGAIQEVLAAGLAIDLCLMQKLGARRRAEAVYAASKLGLI